MYLYPYHYDQRPNHYWGYYWDPRYYNWSYNVPNAYYREIALKDYGTGPLVVNLEDATKQNRNYRTALWTGKYLQMTLMSINVGEDIGLEVHPTTDQFIRIEQGQGLVQMGDSKEHLDFQTMAYEGYAILVPAGTWHNVINTGNEPLKVYVIYAPPHHPFGTVQETKPTEQD
ncbi:cupin domain-containing protein [Paenibacillus glycanilyticus]|uniref:cupin domain-containing protein n=1 Tax=Paenibacillus glycanilyticus TaxID=126569 RepID=UPI001911206D|nr:cupin domain-containing protein [Paenibacillus glycanilyticus]